MNPNELINFLQELKDNIDKEVILLQRAAKISLAFYWIIMIISGKWSHSEIGSHTFSGGRYAFKIRLTRRNDEYICNSF